MSSAQLTDVLQRLRHLSRRDEGRNLTDGELLGLFFQSGDQAAFEELVQRYGAMVLGVCRRMLRDSHDCEDAFQAVFLVLVLKGRDFLTRETIGNWLYGVAYHVALKARAASMHRRLKESQVPAQPFAPAGEQAAWQDLQPLLDQELSRLPDRLREAVLLCDVLGKTRKEAAEQLGIPVGTLSGRLTTAHRVLAKRLTRRGVTLSAGALAVWLPQHAAAACVPASLLACTVRTAGLVATAAAISGVAPPSIAALAQGALQSMWLVRCKVALAVVLGLVLSLAGGAGLLAVGTPHGAREPHDRGRDLTAARPRPPVGNDDRSPVKFLAEKSEQSASGAFVSYKGGTLTLRGKSGLITYPDVSDYKAYQNNEDGPGSKLVHTTAALARLPLGSLVQIDVKGREIVVGLDHRVMGKLEFYKDGTLYLLAADVPKGYVQKPAGKFAVKIDPGIPVLESVEGGDWKYAGPAGKTLSKLKSGAMVTARSEFDPAVIEVIQIGQPKRRMERYVGQTRASVRGQFLSFDKGVLRIRGKGLAPLAVNEYERVVRVRIHDEVPVVESLDGGDFEPTTIEALKSAKEGTVVTVRKVEEVVLEVQIGMPSNKERGRPTR